MQLEVEKTYVKRNGNTERIIAESNGIFRGESGKIWWPDGSFLSDREDELDIIAPAPDHDGPSQVAADPKAELERLSGRCTTFSHTVESLHRERDELKAELAKVRAERDGLFAAAKVWIDKLKSRRTPYEDVVEHVQPIWALIYPEDARPPFTPPPKPEPEWTLVRTSYGRVLWVQIGKTFAIPHDGPWLTKSEFVQISETTGLPL